jgi:Ni,Fe-hydrogenase maturation factor
VQLTPELALDMADKDVVVFVDASVEDSEVAVRSVGASAAEPRTMTHHTNPSALLSMVRSVGSLPGHVYLVSIPASRLDLGSAPTDATAAAAAEGIEIVFGLLHDRA